ncbi:hypothetical protein [Telmatospirillum sp. J64-1]|uniref:hypothetical protein n=1 Tax=Telmatospirillum sp. J64-1 TaxID=2502183 RepID=UPI00115EB0E1|nr:hypothetical protein [Telmatospirillum sp. J64-1]
MTADLEGLKAHLRPHLARRLEQAAASYDDFAAQEAPLDAKGFAAHHAACRAALAHLDLLVKLARWAALSGGEAAGGGGESEAESLLAQARAALDLEEEEP